MGFEIPKQLHAYLRKTMRPLLARWTAHWTFRSVVTKVKIAALVTAKYGVEAWTDSTSTKGPHSGLHRISLLSNKQNLSEITPKKCSHQDAIQRCPSKQPRVLG
jgi:hypothetical protein